MGVTLPVVISQPNPENKLLEIVRFAGLKGGWIEEVKIPRTAEELKDLALKKESIRMDVCKASFSCKREDLAIGLVVTFSDYEKNNLCQWLIANNMPTCIFSFVLTMNKIYITETCNILIAKKQFDYALAICNAMPFNFLTDNYIKTIAQNLYLNYAYIECIELVKNKLSDSNKLNFCDFIWNSTNLNSHAGRGLAKKDEGNIIELIDTPSLVDEHMYQIALSMKEGSKEKNQMLAYFKKKGFSELVTRLETGDLI